jgi:hypothetical protein
MDQPFNVNRRWNAEQDAELARALTNGASVWTIALRLGRTPDAVRKRMIRLGLQPKAWRR